MSESLTPFFFSVEAVTVKIVIFYVNNCVKRHQRRSKFAFIFCGFARIFHLLSVWIIVVLIMIISSGNSAKIIIIRFKPFHWSNQRCWRFYFLLSWFTRIFCFLNIWIFSVLIICSHRKNSKKSSPYVSETPFTMTSPFVTDTIFYL